MKKLSFIIICFAILLNSCQNNSKKTENSKIAETNNIQQEWVDMISNSTLDGWHIFQNESGQKSGWTVEDGVFTFDSEKSQGDGDKSLISDDKFKNFEIKFEWKLSPNSNSGFMWGVNEDNEYDFPYFTGPEIQIIDADVYKDDEKHQVHTTGALYDMIAPDHVMAKPAGEWNSYHIVINHKENKGTVVHNGMEINRFPLHGDKWDEMVANSKFKEWPGFGKFQEGHLCLQDHPGVISFKNIKVRIL